MEDNGGHLGAVVLEMRMKGIERTGTGGLFESVDGVSVVDPVEAECVQVPVHSSRLATWSRTPLRP